MDIQNQKVIINVQGKQNMNVTYSGQTYIINPHISNLVMNLKSKNILESEIGRASCRERVSAVV